MPPPFRPRRLKDFAAKLESFEFRGTRLTGVHVHHTYRPDHKTYRQLGGQTTVAGMHRYHTASLGWSDIAQHESVGPDGLLWSGRSWLRPPASSRGFNGTRQAHPFMFEMIGDFETVADAAHDVPTHYQMTAAIGLCALICNRFQLAPGDTVKFHREMAEKWKSCPGDTIDKDQWINAVENFELDTLTDRHSPVAPDEHRRQSTAYVVRPGDNLWRIAHQHGLSMQQVCDWNDITANHVIHAGDRLQLPPIIRDHHDKT